MRAYTYVLLLFTLLVVIACINNKKSSTVKEKAEETELKSSLVIGKYSGELPCVDCDAISTSLFINDDRSFELRYVYEGKSADEFVRKGRWEILKNKLKLEGVDYQYKIDKNYLVQLDLSGNVITGDLANNYLLTRVDEN